MKRTTLANLILLTTVALFTACSNNTPKVNDAKVTTFDIMGIDVRSVAKTRSEKDIPLAKTYSMESTIPMAKTYPVESYTYETQEVENQPIVEEFNQVVYATYRPKAERARSNYYMDTKGVKNRLEWKAKKLLGLKYVWGATGPRNYDCSGFTQKVYRDVGIKIPRVSRDQAKVGQYVSYRNLKRGDMVFFDTHKKQTGKVTHVGIYLGNGNFIHASSGAKKIVIFNFNRKKFYKKRFLWGRRVIDNNTRIASL